MSGRLRQFEALLEQISAVCNGTATPEQTTLLERQLEDDADARRIYLDYMALHAELCDANIEPPVRPPRGPLVFASLSNIWQRSYEAFLQPVSFSLAVSALTLCVVLAMLAVWGAPSFRQWASRDLPAQETKAQFVAQIVGEVQAEWAGVRDVRAVGEQIAQDDVLRLKKGLIQVEFERGTGVIIEGPATFVARGDNAGMLERGKLVARVPEHATGFALATPQAKVVDLGTEFGVVVGEGGATDIQVFEGVVEVAALGVDVSAEDEPSTLVLTDGQVVRVAGGQCTDVMAEQARWNFVRHMPAGSVPSERGAPWDGVTVWLSNLFDDPQGASLSDAVPSDTYRAEADDFDLGVDTALQGGLDGPVVINRGGLMFDFRSAGGGTLSHGLPTNDCVSGESYAIRTFGKPMDRGGENRRAEDGIGIHANALVTFDLEELRAAGMPEGELVFLARAAVNDSRVNNPESTLHTVVLLSDDRAVLAGYVNGQVVDVAKANSAWAFSGELPECFTGNTPLHQAEFNVAIPSKAKYLTLAVTDANQSITSDHGVFAGARLVIREKKKTPDGQKSEKQSK